MKRKWIIGILVIVAVGAILAVVFINMFTNKSTDAMAKNLDQAVSEGYLCETSDEYGVLNEYFEEVSSALAAQSDEEQKVTLNCQKLYVSLTKEAKILNSQLAFSEYTNVYKNSNKKIENLLKSAQKHANDAKAYIQSTKNLTNPSQYWTAGTWYECKDMITKMIADTNNALRSIAEVYKAGVNSKLFNNKLSSLIFETEQNLADDVLKDLKVAGAADGIYNFTQIYFSSTSLEIIMSYQYDSTVKDKVDEILNAENRAESPAYLAFLEGNLS